MLRFTGKFYTALTAMSFFLQINYCRLKKNNGISSIDASSIVGVFYQTRDNSTKNDLYVDLVNHFVETIFYQILELFYWFLHWFH